MRFAYMIYILTWIVFIVFFLRYVWLKMKIPLSRKNKLIMRIRDGKYDYDDLKVILSVDGIMESYSCIAHVCFGVTWKVVLLWYERLRVD